MSVRVRFAPSPTGYLHVGGLRTALYNYLFAKRHGGTCILRIEDTDRTRFVEDAQENLVNALKWAGIEFDEGPNIGGSFGPYVQSERFDIYREYANKLLANDTAYYAFDTAEEIEAMRHRQQHAGLAPKYDRSTMKNQYTLGENETKRLISEGVEHVIRLKVPLSGEVKFSDLIRGEVSVQCKDVDDQILLKSDGFPTYHLANVVDDHFMQISHVIRGEEWLPSTPKHVLLYQAFGWESPKFAHLPLLLNEDKSKLSKRNGDVAVEDFRDKGYFKEAFVNFVALLGWNPSADREIFTMQELIDSFTIEKVNKAGAIFDRQRLLWFNSQYLRSKSLNELAIELEPMLKDAGYTNLNVDYIEKVIGLLRERTHFLHEFVAFGEYMWKDDFHYEEEYKIKQWTEANKELLPQIREYLANQDEFTHDSLHESIKEFLSEKGLKMGAVFHLLRMVVTGKQVGAGVFETLEVLGKSRTLDRIDKFIKEN